MYFTQKAQKVTDFSDHELSRIIHELWTNRQEGLTYDQKKTNPPVAAMFNRAREAVDTRIHARVTTAGRTENARIED